MRKALLIVAAAVLLAAVLVTRLRGNHDAIARAQAEAATLQHERDSLLAVVQRQRDTVRALAARRATAQSAAANLRRSVDSLERSRVTGRSAVRQLRATGQLQDRLRAAYPALDDSAWGLTTLPIEPGDTVGIEYLMVPAWFAESFIIDNENARSWRAQKDRLLAVDSLRLTITALQDSITGLEVARADAYRAGYESASTSYQELSRQYVDELKRPRFSLGSTLLYVASAGVGLVLGRAL